MSLHHLPPPLYVSVPFVPTQYDSASSAPTKACPCTVFSLPRYAPASYVLFMTCPCTVYPVNFISPHHMPPTHYITPTRAPSTICPCTICLFYYISSAIYLRPNMSLHCGPCKIFPCTKRPLLDMSLHHLQPPDIFQPFCFISSIENFTSVRSSLSFLFY